MRLCRLEDGIDRLLRLPQVSGLYHQLSLLATRARSRRSEVGEVPTVLVLILRSSIKTLWGPCNGSVYINGTEFDKVPESKRILTFFCVRIQINKKNLDFYLDLLIFWQKTNAKLYSELVLHSVGSASFGRIPNFLSGSGSDPPDPDPRLQYWH
jgi:hypothetical protein